MAKISPEIIDQVRMASDIVEVVSGYLTLRKRGKNYFGLCPFHHEKTPSFSVNPEMQIFHCFGCGAGGNVFTFIMRMEGITFPESVRILARAAGINIPEEDESVEQLQEKEALFYANKMAADFYLDNLLTNPEAEPARAYLEKRGLTQEIYQEFGLGYAPAKWDAVIRLAKSRSLNPEILVKAGLALEKEGGGMYDRFRGRITFAIHNLSGQIVAFGARRIVDDNSPKYINSPETDIYQKRYILYGLYQSREHIRRANEVIIVEGYTDLISLSRSGVRNVVATSGTALTEEHSRLLRRYTSNATILYDSDSAGASAALRGGDILLQNGLEVKIATLPAGQDPDDFCRQSGADAIRELVARAVPIIDFKLQGLKDQGLLRTPSQKAAATRDLLASIARISDPIQRSFLVRDLAEKLHVEESALWSEMRKHERQSRVRVQSEGTQKQAVESKSRYFESRRGAAELGLLEVALNEPQLIGKILQNVRHDDFKHPEIRELFIKFEEEYVDSSRIDAQNYLATIQDPYIAEHLSHSLLIERDQENTGKYIIDCVIALQLAHIDEHIDHIRDMIRQARGDDQTIRELMDEYRELVEERKRVVRGEYVAR